MAGKGAYPMGSGPPAPPPNLTYPAAPPPYQAAAPPPVYQANPVYPQSGVQIYPGKGQTTVVVQQQPPRPQPKVQTSPGLFGMLSKEFDVAANMISREADYIGRQFTGTVDQHASTQLLHCLLGFVGKELSAAGKMFSREADSAGRFVNKELNIYAVGNMISSEVNKTADTQLLKNFQTSNVIQLISAASGRALQIVSSPTGQLVVDGLGNEGNIPQAQNAHWTVINEGKNQIRLHNNMNFLAISKGFTCVINAHQYPNVQQGVETKFQLSQVGLTQFVTLESIADRGKYVGVMPDGQLKSALATCRNQHGQFGVRLIYSPYPSK